MSFPFPQSLRFPLILSLVFFGLLGRIDTAMAQQDVLVASPTSYTFNSTLGGGFQSTVINIGSSGAALNYNVQTDGTTWLAASTTQSVTPGQITVSVNPSGLAIGTYTGNVIVTPSGAGTTPITIPIGLVISTASAITVSPSAMTFMATAGTTLATQPVALSVASATNGLNYTTSISYLQTNVPAWLNITPTLGTTPATLAVTANPTSLTAGTYTATITVSGGQGANQVVNVTFTITGLPTLTASPASIPFFYQIGQSQTPSNFTQTTLTVSSGTNSNVPATLSTSVSNCPGFLGVSQTGSVILPVTIQVFAAGLGSFTQSQTCSGSITVTSSSTSNPTITIPVTLTVSNNPLIQITPLSASFTYQAGGPMPGNDNLTITSTTSGIPFTVSTSQPWLAVTTSGVTSTNSTISLSLVASQVASLIPNTYTATVTVTAAGAANSPITIPVTLTVGANAMLTISPPFANFVYELGQQLTLNTQQIQIGSTGASLPFTISVPTTTGTQFVTVNPVSGVAPTAITISANPGNLPPGTYNTIVSVAPSNGGTAQNIPVQLTISPAGQPLLNVSTQALAFSYSVGSNTLPPTLSVSLTSTDSNIPLTITNVQTNASWVNTSFLQGSNLTTPQSLTVSVNPQVLQPSVTPYTTNLVITAAAPGGVPVTATVQVTFSYTSGITLTANPTSLTFSQVVNAATPAAVSVSLGASGSTTGATLPFSTTVSTLSGGSWLAVSPTSGTAPASISISVTALAASLTPGTYQGSVVVYGSGAANPNGTLTIPVTLTVTAAPTLTVSTGGLTFSGTVNGSNPQTQTFQVTAPNAISSVTFSTAVSTATGGSWLSVSGGTATPATLTVSANLSGLAQGTYTGSITITPSGGGAATVVPVSFTVGAQLAPSATQVINAASGATGGVAPGELVSIFGTALGPVTPAGLTLNAQGNVTTTLAGVTVTFNGIPAPLTYVSATQINCVVPFEVASTATAQMQVSYNGSTSGATALTVQPTLPGIFTQNASGSGNGAILLPNYSTVTSSNAAPRGSTIIIYATGGGQTSPASVTGAVSNGIMNTTAKVTVTIGGVAATVAYAGSAPGLVEGVLQINAVVPTTISAGVQPILITVGNNTSANGVTVPVQ